MKEKPDNGAEGCCCCIAPPPMASRAICSCVCRIWSSRLTEDDDDNDDEVVVVVDVEGKEEVEPTLPPVLPDLPNEAKKSSISSNPPLLEEDEDG